MGYQYSMANLAPADYIIFKEGTRTVGINIKTGRRVLSDTDSHTVIQGCIDLLDDGRGGIIHLNPADYTITDTIELYRNYASGWTPIWLRGSGIFQTKLFLDDNINKDFISFDVSAANDDGFKKISDLCIDGNKNNQSSGNGIIGTVTGAGSIFDFNIEQVEVLRCKENGINIDRGWGTKIRSCISESNETNGIRLYNHNQTYVSDTALLYNDQDGIYSAGNNAMVNNCYFGINEKHNLEALGFKSSFCNLSMVRWGTAGSSYASIKCDGDCNIFSNISIDGDSNAASKYGVHFDLNSDYCVMTNVISRNCDTYDFYLRGNYHRFSNLIHNGTMQISSLTVSTIDGVGIESANAEEPQDTHWLIGSIVQFTDSGDASGDGLYIKNQAGTWVKID